MNDAKMGATTTLAWRDGTILIEGVILRVENSTGASALKRLVELVEHCPSSEHLAQNGA